MRMRFSERYGFKPVREAFQSESMDTELKNGLWNTLHTHFWSYGNNVYVLSGRENSRVYPLVRKIWMDYLKYSLDKLPSGWRDTRVILNHYFFNTAEWYEVYDFIEFVASVEDSEKFREDCNQVLEKEMSAYRFVGEFIAPIIDDIEINEIETAIGEKTSFAARHLSNALDLLSDRSTPDYRNSIKESISAVESICKLIVGDPSTTLGRAINKLETETGIVLHDDLKEGLKKIYHYTSDSAGIRHAIKDDSTVDFEEAKFMLVMCSSFVNYLIAKADKAGIAFS
ncbi:AbiJ-NTD4 domain-containing protein [Domibacillus sp.]|uniref:AbiJ-NTD4 domain-containing protein n=1 Tax=Domibacillus sp. TaxID=1969783 RepID=UPI002811FE52|nr:hypothetical protein [Domibacillus sp.]